MGFFRKHFFLILIIILASALRLYSLDSAPAGLNADEAALGYNAYSLMLTGKDEYGTPWPLTFKSFGDYKPGIYAYLTLPFIVILGLNEWAVRLPSTLLGIGTIVLVYLLALEIFQKKRVALLTSLLLAISPWHLHFSRGGWETNVATFFIVLGVLLFIKGLSRPLLIFWSLIAFLLSMYTYQSPRLVVPVLVIILGLFYAKKLLSSFKKISFYTGLVLLLTLAVLSVPLILQFTSSSATARFDGLSFTSDPGPLLRNNELRSDHSKNELLARLMHNKFTAYGNSFLGHYLDHFNPKFLFIEGDPIIRNKVPEMGQFYKVELIFLIIGLTFLVRSRLEHGKLIFIWIMVAPLASAMTYQTPHALRALNLSIPLILLMGLGFDSLLNWSKIKWKKIVIGLLLFVLIFEIAHYLESYYSHYSKRYPLAWEYGFKQMVEKLNKYEGSFEKVVITDRYDQPYILVLFFKKYDPLKYQPQANLSVRDKFNFGTVRSFDKYEFRSFDKGEASTQKGTLFIGTSDEIPEDKIIDRVNFPNGQPAFLFSSGSEKRTDSFSGDK